jgi:hypothetical protein
MARTSSAQEHALTQSAERLAPWLAAPILIGVLQVTVVLSGAELSRALQAVMILCLCGSIAVATVVASRSSREADVLGREERERPSRHELAGADDFGRRQEVGPAAYLASMERWSAAMLELTEHAAGTQAAIDAGAVDELTSASSDTRELRELLQSNANVPLKNSAIATLRGICSLWEAEQMRIESLAATMDPEWYRRWRARSIADRLLRRGSRQSTTTALPYRT